MRKRSVVRWRRFYGVLRMTSLLLFIALLALFLSIQFELSASAKEEDDIIVFTEADGTEETAADTPGLVSLVYTTTYSSDADDPTEPCEEHPPLYTEADAIALAKMAWGEALVTNSDTEIAAAMWCALNRFDSGDPYYKNCDSIEAIVRQNGAFSGYSVCNPVDEHMLTLAYDVLDRWNSEQYGETDVGRVLPAEYMFFHGDGRHNHFRIGFRRDGRYYDWSLESPYEN